MDWRKLLGLKNEPPPPDYKPLTEQQFHYLWAIGELNEQGNERAKAPEIHAMVARLGGKPIDASDQISYYALLNALDELLLVRTTTQVGRAGETIDRPCTLTAAGTARLLEIKHRNNLQEPETQKSAQRR